MSTKSVDQPNSGGRPSTLRAANGTAEWIPNRTGGGKYVARITGINGKRIRLGMLGTDGEPLFTNKTADKGKAHRFAEEMSKQTRDVQAHAPVLAQDDQSTVEGFGLQWTSGALFKMYGEVKRLRLKKSARDDHNRLALYLYRYIGKMRVADVTEEIIEKTFAKAARDFEERNGYPMSQPTKRHMYMVAHRLFDLAIKPGRLRADNPVSEDLLPAKGPSKLYSFLYPQELLDLLACTDIPIARRVYYATGTYTGLRKSSLKAFAWSAFDFEHFTITSLISKTDEYIGPQMFAQKDATLPGLESLIELLRRYRELLSWPVDSELLFTNKALRLPKEDAEATVLRMDLECAGITRKVLFTKTAKIEPLRFHDLRATFVTWARRAGKGSGWIGDRTGHLTKEIMRRYDRGARSLADLQIEPFPNIALAIPELATLNVTRMKSKKKR